MPTTDSSRRCAYCKRDLPETLEHWWPSAILRRNGQPCRQCAKEWRQRYTQTASYKSSQRKYKNSARGRQTSRRNWLQATYGISLEDYEAMLAAQGGVCRLCGQPEHLVRQGRVQPLAVDHCHTTGRVRGLLCTRCNTIVGLAEESVPLLQAVIGYIQEQR